MQPVERHMKILKILCQRRFENIKNLSHEFGVSERTIRRDLELLSLDHAIYTKKGKYGGIYTLDTFNMDRMYMEQYELDVLKKISSALRNSKILNHEEKDILDNIIFDYTQPQKLEKGMN